MKSQRPSWVLMDAGPRLYQAVLPRGLRGRAKYCSAGEGGPVSEVGRGGVVQGVAPVHVVEAVGVGFGDDGAGFGVVGPRNEDVDVGVGMSVQPGNKGGGLVQVMRSVEVAVQNWAEILL